jgi:hypothetical protein
MAATQNYASTPRAGIGKLSAANVNRDGTGTIVQVFNTGTSGSRVEAIAIQATAATTQGMVRLFIHDGTTASLWAEVPVTAISTPSGTTPAFSKYLTTANLSDLLPLVLPTGHSLRAATHNAEPFNVIATGGDF